MGSFDSRSFRGGGAEGRGTENTWTGEYWKAGEGRPYDYVNFEGKNPKYNETMQEINTRQLWERHVQGR